MVRTDSYTPPSEKRYECNRCANRTVTEETLTICPECGGNLRNLAVPRE